MIDILSINNMLPFVDLDYTEQVVSWRDALCIMYNPCFRCESSIPYLSQWLTCVVCLDGSSTGRINGRSYSIRQGQMCIIFPGQQVEGNFHSDGFRGLYVVMSTEFVSRVNVANTFASRRQLDRFPLVNLKEGQVEIMQSYCRMCRDIINGGDEANRDDALLRLTEAVFLAVSDSTHPDRGALGRYDGSQTDIAYRFIELVEIHFRQHRSVAWYAGQMNLTLKHLSNVVSSATDMTASKWIDRFVLHYAQERLVGTSLTVQQISNELGFASQTHFARYFKNITGITPSEYRLTKR